MVLPDAVVDLATSLDRSCALTARGELYCATTESETEVFELARSDIRSIYQGIDDICVLRRDGGLECFADDHTAAARSLTRAESWRPDQGDTLVVGGTFLCVTGPSRMRLECAFAERPGSSNGTDARVQRWSTRSFPLSRPVAMVAAGVAHLCYIDRSGAVYCIGQNDRGQLGAARPDQQWTIVPVQFGGARGGAP